MENNLELEIPSLEKQFQEMLIEKRIAVNHLNDDQLMLYKSLYFAGTADTFKMFTDQITQMKPEPAQRILKNVEHQIVDHYSEVLLSQKPKKQINDAS